MDLKAIIKYNERGSILSLFIFGKKHSEEWNFEGKNSELDSSVVALFKDVLKKEGWRGSFAVTYTNKNEWTVKRTEGVFEL